MDHSPAAGTGKMIARGSIRRIARVHRSTIVRIDRIAELVPDLHGDFRIRLKNGAELALSRTYRARVEAQFGRKF